MNTTTGTDTMTITNPDAPATAAQVELIRHLASQFAAYKGREHLVVAKANTKAKASDCITKLMAAGATKPVKPSSKPSAGTKATPKQVAFAMSLIRKGAWSDGAHGSFPCPTQADLAKMTKAEISAIIDGML